MENKHINQELELQIITTIIANNFTYAKIQGLVKPEHFATLEIQKLYRFFEEKVNQMEVNILTCKNFLQVEFKEFENFFREFFNYYSNLSIVNYDLVSLAKELIELYQKREFDTFISKLNQGGYYTFDEIKNNVLTKLYDLEVGNNSDPKNILDGINEIMSNNQTTAIYSNFKQLDFMCGGFELGNLVIVGGKPSSGKTTFSLCMAMQMAMNYSVCFFSVEVKAVAIYRKFLNNIASMQHYKIKTKTYNAYEEELLKEKIQNEKVIKRQLLVDDTKKLTINLLRSKIKKILLRNKLDAIFIDYLQLMTPEGKDFSREQQIAKIAIGLKQIATEFNIVVVALSQLSRNSDVRENKKPVLSDLRDSGSIEASADIVLFVHRDHYYLLQTKPPEHNQAKFMEWQQMAKKVEYEADIIIAKNRDGICGDVKFIFDKEYSRFSEAQNDTY